MVDMTAHSHNRIICAQSKRWSRMQSTQWQSDVNPVERCQDSFWRLGSYDRQWVVTTVSGHLGSYDLSTVKGFKSRKLISRFRCGCHGLHVDTGRLLPLTQQVPREQRHCVFLHIILCLIALHIVPSGTDSQTYFGAQPLHCLLFTLHDPKVIARFLRECFGHRNTLVAAQFGHTL